MNRIGFWLVSLLVALAVASSLFFVVNERQYGVVYQLSEIRRVVKEPGLHLKWLPSPFQTVDYLDNRLLTLESNSTEPSLTAEKQWVVIDWYVRWRIADPEAYIRNVGRSEQDGAAQLSRVVRSAFQEEVNRRTVRQLLSEQRQELMDAVLKQVSQSVGGATRTQESADGQSVSTVVGSWGIEIADVRITRVDYSKDITESVFNRMKAERAREAERLRSEGLAEGERIRANAERQATKTRADAYKEAQETRAVGDSAATRTFADAFGKDPEFAQFYRSLQAYRNSLGQPGDVMVLNPAESEFFKAMRTDGAGAK
ncbi:protease modulator HflC [Lampropedia puyangensis]|uniref:Protein HflC n=1 Tax=Lampropedia puyangensis TaxID=1330072 RepID=A0A4S8F902_9BURK|nr:protease modulator HflC [Lampropedia puyangensis]THU01952.1 protease modulator HflC [Lampropedia puyangensis]